VLRVADIKGMYREFVSNQYSEVETVRRKKEEQIDKLIDQNAKALESIGNLVDVIKHKA
jgi:chorismate synthase